MARLCGCTAVVCTSAACPRVVVGPSFITVLLRAWLVGYCVGL
eukprot:contig_14653_g3516